MIFERLTLESKNIFSCYLTDNPLFVDYYGSELNFQNLYVWKDTDQVEIHEEENKVLYVRSIHNQVITYLPPIARNWPDFFDALRKIESDCVEHNRSFIVRGLTKEMAEAIQHSDLKYRIAADRDLFEYLYASEDLRTLSGKKFHNKRNLLNQFQKQNSFQIKSYSVADLPLIMELLSQWEEQKMHAFEHDAIVHILENLEAIDCFCDLIIIDDKAVAFAIGTKNTRTGLVLFEKADTSYTGVYAAMNYYFANRHFADVPLINRQEDLGIAELKRAKMSYNPIGFAEKYSITRNHLTMEEVYQLKALYHEAFDDSDGFLNYFFQQKYRAENVMFYKVDQQIVSALHFIPKTLSIRKSSFFCPFVVAAATLKAYRGKGYMHQLLHQSLIELYNRNTVLCGLSPFDEGFYAETGFVTVNRSLKKTASTISDERITTVEIDRSQLNLIKTVYDEKMQNYDLFVKRDEQYWNCFYDEVMSDRGKIILVRDEGRPIGYFSLFENSVEELCFLDEKDIEKVSLLNQSTITMVDHMGLESHAMIRIVDAKKMLLQYPYSKEFNLVKRLKITDAFFDFNNVIVELVIKDGVASLRDIEEYDEEITVEKMTEAIFVSGSDLFEKPNTLIYDRY